MYINGKGTLLRTRIQEPLCGKLIYHNGHSDKIGIQRGTNDIGIRL